MKRITLSWSDRWKLTHFLRSTYSVFFLITHWFSVRRHLKASHETSTVRSQPMKARLVRHVTNRLVNYDSREFAVSSLLLRAQSFNRATFNLCFSFFLFFKRKCRCFFTGFVKLRFAWMLLPPCYWTTEQVRLYVYVFRLCQQIRPRKRL